MSFKKILFVCFLLCSGLAAGQGWNVIPGDGVGALSVGMTSKAAAMVVKPTRILDGKAGMPALVEYGSDLVIEYDSGGKASIISILSNTLNTRNGPVKWSPYEGGAIGTPWMQVQGRITSRRMSHKLPTAKGYPNEDYHAYPELGLGFRVKGGSIFRVDIWKR